MSWTWPQRAPQPWFLRRRNVRPNMYVKGERPFLSWSRQFKSRQASARLWGKATRWADIRR